MQEKFGNIGCGVEEPVCQVTRGWCPRNHSEDGAVVLDRSITSLLQPFESYLHAEEREVGTIEKYLRNVRQFEEWLNGRGISKEMATGWKKHLLSAGYNPATVNSMLSSLNRFFGFIGREDCRVKYLRIQRRIFRQREKELTKNEYHQLLDTAQRLGRQRLALLMEAICATGIRVSEVRYLTVEVARAGKAEISLKGKVRTILLPGKLCRKLLKYARKQKIVSGELFLTRNGKSISRTQIWAEMKALCQKAEVAPSKVFPHNLRHLFACTYYRVCRDIAKLADLLGHSSIETTRIYLVSSGQEHARQIERLGLIC